MKRKLYFYIFILFVGLFSFFDNVLAAPISIEQIDVGDVTVPLPFDDVDGYTGRVLLNNGDVVFIAKYIGSSKQIYYYNQTTGETTLISVAPDGTTEGNGASANPSVSIDGNYVAFESYATNLVTGDTNGLVDVFVRNINTGTTSLVSVNSSEVQGDGESANASISADGNYVTFQSGSTNLVTGDINDQYDIFIRNIVAGTTALVSVNSDEIQGDTTSYYPDISSDGNYVTFQSYATNLVAGDINGQPDIFIRNTVAGTTERVSVSSAEIEADNVSEYPSISADGNLVVFKSNATNLVAGDTNNQTDIFIRNIGTGTTERVSVDSDEAEIADSSNNSFLSADGNYVVFESYSADLVAGDVNGASDIFLRNIALGTTTRVSVSDSEVEGNDVSAYASVSPDGSKVAFLSDATNLVAGDTNTKSDIFLRNITLGATELISNAEKFTTNSYSSDSGCDCVQNISADHRYVSFQSDASNLVSGDTNVSRDIFVRDTDLDVTTRISVDSNEEESNDASLVSSISSDGNYVVFESSATNLVVGDTNAQTDIFLRDITLGTTTRVSVDSDEVESDGESHNAVISANGNYVVFYSYATNLAAGDTNGAPDIFLRDIVLGTTTRLSLSDALVEGNNNSDFPSISADGNIVVFRSYATNLVAGDTNGAADIFIHNVTLGTTSRISLSDAEVQGNSDSDSPHISADGNLITFASNASNLVVGDINGAQDIFLRDIALGTTTRISIDSSELESDSTSYNPSISDDGSYITFYSDATNLVANDTNGQSDVFYRDIDLGTTSRVSSSISDIEGNNISTYSSISPDGLFVAFTSTSTNLIDGVTGPGGGNYFLARMSSDPTPDPEPTPEVVHSSSGSRITKKVFVTPEHPSTPILTPTDCLPSYKFSPSTGQPCPLEINVPDTSEVFIFFNNLSSGMIHPDVKELQKYLNTHGFSVALFGPGSIGSETTKFGALTKAALIKFQLANSINPPVGFFGPITRGVINAN